MFVAKVDGIDRLPHDTLGDGLGHTAGVLFENVQHGQLAVLKH